MNESWRYAEGYNDHGGKCSDLREADGTPIWEDGPCLSIKHTTMITAVPVLIKRRDELLSALKTILDSEALQATKDYINTVIGKELQ